MAFDEDLEDLLTELERCHPDPVDGFENELARRLGLRRFPWTPEPVWRDARVAFINAEASADAVAEELMEIDF